MRRRLLVIGCILVAAISLWANGQSEIIPNLGMKRIEDTVIEKISKDADLQVGAVAAAVNVYRDSSADTVSAVLTGQASSPIDLKSSGSRNSRTISTDWHNKKSITTKDLVLEIHLPREFRGDLSIETVSGAISLPSGTLESVSLEAVSGSIRFNDVTAESISLNSVSGSIQAVGITAEDLEAETTSGKISIKGSVEDSIELQSISGSIQFSGDADSIDANTTSGKISLDLDSLLDSIDAGSISGSIDITIPKGLPVYGSVSSVSGSKDIDLSTAQTSSSNKTIEFSTGQEDVEIEATTVSGSIQIQE